MRLVFLLLTSLLLSSPALAEPVVGRASVTDGDTLEVAGTKIRLHGIDAPESSQLCQDAAGATVRCGQRAALALAERIGSAPVTCTPRDTDRYGRTVAVCTAGGTSLNAWLVREGHALAYRRYIRAYVPLEGAARRAKRGIWTGTFTDPARYRACMREAGARAAACSAES